MPSVWTNSLTNVYQLRLESHWRLLISIHLVHISQRSNCQGCGYDTAKCHEENDGNACLLVFTTGEEPYRGYSASLANNGWSTSLPVHDQNPVNGGIVTAVSPPPPWRHVATALGGPDKPASAVPEKALC
uniref:BHLH domain-containing protein n=1 Tax=Mesocestoides corti TaxID=53468 RepID=A0A5K3FAS6_MESCO